MLLLPFDKICPPENGGMQTCYNMVLTLGKYFDLTVLMNQKVEEFKVYAGADLPPDAVLLNVKDEYEEPKDIFRLFPHKFRNAMRYRWYTRTFKESAGTSFLNYTGILPKLLTKKHFDYIIFEVVNDLRVKTFIRKFSPSTKLIFQNHNVDSDLAYQGYLQGKVSYTQYSKLLALESQLYRNVDQLLAVSKEDGDRLNEINKGNLNVEVIQTGIHLQNEPAITGVGLDSPKEILFCGSLNYKPNFEGLKWFYDHCWKSIVTQMTQIKLVVIGSGIPHHSLNELLEDPTILFKGRVNDVKEYYDRASVVIVPLLSGSGIRLKVLEALSMGVPIVSTEKGAEGILYQEDENILIADNQKEFTNKVLFLLKDREKRIRMSESGRNLIIHNYEWSVIGKRVYNILCSHN